MPEVHFIDTENVKFISFKNCGDFLENKKLQKKFQEIVLEIAVQISRNYSVACNY